MLKYAPQTKYFRAGPKPIETFRPSRPGLRPEHETLRVTKGHENARPSAISDNRRSQTLGLHELVSANVTFAGFDSDVFIVCFLPH